MSVRCCSFHEVSFLPANEQPDIFLALLPESQDNAEIVRLQDFCGSSLIEWKDALRKCYAITVILGCSRPLILGGLGKLPEQVSRKEIGRELLERIRVTIGKAMVKARELHARTVGLITDSLTPLVEVCDLPTLVREAVYGAINGLYRYTQVRTTPMAANPDICVMLPAGPKDESTELQQAISRAEAEAEAVRLVRDLVNTPANMLGPLDLAATAKELCAPLPITCTVLDKAALIRQGFGAMLSVARGSVREPALVCLDYTPAGQENSRPLVLVGKGLCFDTGGICLKPRASMEDMKSDMAGAATVLAAVVLAARLGGRQRVVAIMACAENMPDAGATRPGDVVTCLNGNTVEVINTDAEGRLVLCDALTYAQQTYRPHTVVDIATLTGACVVALGPDVAGLFCSDVPLIRQISNLGATRGDWFWPMPVWDCYAANLESTTADLSNVGPRQGGAITAAIFLKHFMQNDVRWAHLDVAGPAYCSKKTTTKAAGGTGFATRTLAALALGEGEAR